jgi:hypothetical protein
MKRNGINVKNILFLFVILRGANFLPRIPHAVVLPEDGQVGCNMM